MNEPERKQRIIKKLTDISHRVLTSPIDGIIFTENVEVIDRTLFGGDRDGVATGWKTITIRYFDPYTKDI